MSLPYTLKLFALCILIAAPLISAQATPLHKDLYIDPSSTTSPTGNIDAPFTTLSAAFEAAQNFINGNPSPQPLAVSLLIKEDATLSNEQGQISLSLDGTNRDLSSVKLTTYGPPGSSVHKPATVQISNSVPHIAMTIPEVKLIIENLIFQINIEQGLNQPEIILIDGKDSEVTFSHCAFKNSKVVDQNGDHSVFTLSAGRYLFKNCEFSQLDLSIPLITHQGSQSSIIKYELNQFHDITVKGGSLIRANKAVTFDLISSKVQNTTGRILNVTETVNTILSDNTFIDTVGQYPISLKAIQKVIAGKNKISYAPSEHANHQGFLSLANFDVLGISDTSVSEYFGLNSAILIASESTYQPAHTPMVILNGLTLNKNGLCVHDDQANLGLALISVDLKQKAVISIENSQFIENTFYDMREHPTGRAQGASTFWIQAETSSLKIKKMTLENNKADRSLSNLYASVDDLNVIYSTFKSNTQLEGAEASQNIDGSVIFSNFGWFGQDLVFTEDLFKGNYNDFGGAISIREADGLRVPRFVTVENCTFVDNKAKEGGAIYSNVAIQSFQRENNTFEGNQAPVDPDMSAILGKLDTSKPKLFLEVISQSLQSEKRSYVSGEFKLEDVASGQDTGYSMEFYISDHKNTRMQSTKQYYASISMASTRAGEAYLVHNFTNQLTGPSITLTSFTVVAPLGAMNAVQVLMRNKDDPNEIYTFEFQVNMKIGVLEPGRPRNCKRGEVYVEKQQACVKCPPGTYSLTPNALACQLCITGADCSQGGDQIKALPGYWRDPTSDGFSVYACADKSKCLGGAENHCAEGYAGPLCEACNTRDTKQGIYRPFLRNTCKSCNSKDIWEIVGDIVGLTAPIAILLYTLKTIIGSKAIGASAKQFSWCLYTNIFINYLQNLFILGVLDYVPLPYMFNYIINVIANPSFPIFGYLTCYFPSLVTSGRSYIGIFSLFASIPFMKILLVLLMAKLVARRGNAFKSSVLGLMWLGFLEAPGVLDFCLRFFSCKQVGNWVYSPFFLDIECDSSNFELLRTIVLIPAVLIITVICPLAVTYSLSRGSLRSDEVEGQKTLRVIMLAKSADHIEKSHRSWLYFYIATFGKLGLLLLSTSDTSSFATFSVVMLYFGAMALLNTQRKILPFSGWRCTLLFVDMGMLLTSAVLGYGLEFVQGSIKSLLLTALWVGNAGYLLSVNLFSSSTKQGGDQYGKLQEEGLPSSEEEESGRGHKSEQLDQTV